MSRHCLEKYLVFLLGFFIPISTAISNILLLFVFIVWILDFNKEVFIDIIKHPIFIAICCFISLFLMRLLYEHDGTMGEIAILKKIIRLLYIPVLLSIFFSKKTFADNALKGFSLAVIVTLSIGTLKVLYLKYSSSPRHYSVFFDEHDVFKDHIITSLFIAMAVFTWGHQALSGSRIKWGYFGIMLYGGLYLFIVSHGRSGQIVMIGLIVLLLLQKVDFKKSCNVLVLLFISLVLLFMVPSSFKKRTTTFITELNNFVSYQDTQLGIDPLTTSIGQRAALMSNTWKFIKQKPILGWGTGYLKDGIVHIPEQKSIARNPHSQYLLIALQLGIVGFIGILSFFGFFMLESFKLQGQSRYLSQGALLAMSMGCLANSWLNDAATMQFFIFFMGLCYANNVALK